MTRRLRTGFATLDHQLGGGLRRGELIVVGGPAGIGCSALAIGVALGSAQQGARTALVSTESRADRLTERVLEQFAGVPQQQIRDHCDGILPRPQIARAERGLAELDLRLASAPHDLAEEWHQIAGHDWDLAVIDGLEGLLNVPQGRQEQAAAWVLRLKRMAVAQNGVVLLTCHTPLPSADPGSSDPRPGLADFGADGAIAAQADMVWGIYREEHFRPDRGVTGAAEILILKDREGPRGAIDFWFEAACRRFEDLSAV